MSLVMRPSVALITSISNANPCTITCSAAVDYSIHQQLRIRIPQRFGMRQLDNRVVELIGFVTDSSFFIGINTINFDPYIAYGGPTPEFPMTVPVGTAHELIPNTFPSDQYEYGLEGAFFNATEPLSGI